VVALVLTLQLPPLLLRKVMLEPQVQALLQVLLPVVVVVRAV
jgi:hypothetical protein